MFEVTNTVWGLAAMFTTIGVIFAAREVAKWLRRK